MKIVNVKIKKLDLIDIITVASWNSILDLGKPRRLLSYHTCKEDIR